jgi:lipid II:glycine glycyltransferase (peptidoglycan interpeptide bridge formation enzyme)
MQSQNSMLSSSAMYHVINGPMASAVLNNNNNDLKQELNQLNAENEQLRRKLNTKTNECEKLKIKVKETRDECENFKHLMRQLSESMNLINGTNSSGLYQVFKLIN